MVPSVYAYGPNKMLFIFLLLPRSPPMHFLSPSVIIKLMLTNQRVCTNPTFPFFTDPVDMLLFLVTKRM